MSFAPEVKTTGEKWTGNALRFETREEANANVLALMDRWYAVTDTRVVESDDEVNYEWTKSGLKAVVFKTTAEVLSDV
jgi:hypothetical protein